MTLNELKQQDALKIVSQKQQTALKGGVDKREDRPGGGTKTGGPTGSLSSSGQFFAPLIDESI